MNGWWRFVTLGMADADRRVAAALTPPEWKPVDEYLKTSAVVAFIDRLTQWLRDVSLSSASGRWLLRVGDSFSHQGWRERYREVGVILLAAVAVNLALTAWQGPRPGWFWAVIPALVTTFAVVLLAASSAKSAS